MGKEKKSIFSGFLNFIGKTIGGKETISQKSSRFRYFLLELDPNDESYYFVNYSADLCEVALEIVKKRLAIARKIEKLNESIIDVECYNNLSEEDALYLKDLLERIISLSNERRALMYQVTGFDKSLTSLVDLEEEAMIAVDQMEEAEKLQRLFRQDVAVLEGEKDNLENERTNLVAAQKFMHRFSMILVFLFTGIMMLLSFLAIFQQFDIFLPIAVMVIMVIIFGSLIYFLRRRMRFDLAMNVKRQQKAIELLNKKSVLYAYYTNFLRYACKKYQVRNAKTLRNNLNDFRNYKHLAGRLDSITNIIYQTEKQLDAFLHTRNIENVKSTPLKFAKTLNIEDKKRYYNDLIVERTALENNLDALDTQHESVWSQLLKFNDDDKTKDNIIDRMITAYLDEVSKFMEMMETLPQEDEEEEEEENIQEKYVLNENSERT